MPHRQNQVEDQVHKIYSTESETLSPALISFTGVLPRAVIGSDHLLPLVEKSSAGGIPNIVMKWDSSEPKLAHLSPTLCIPQAHPLTTII